MTRMSKPTVCILALVLLMTGGAATVLPAEPANSDYTCSPIFTSTSVTPNVLIILDNSGSMNLNAYGTAGPWAGEDVDADFIDTSGSNAYIGWIVNEEFVGEPYNTFDVRIPASADEAEERESSGVVDLTDDQFDLGRSNDDTTGYDQIVGLRFKNVQIPQGATITNAYIEFTAGSFYNCSYSHTAAEYLDPPTNSNPNPIADPTSSTYDGNCQSDLELSIHGQDVNDALTFSDTANDISGRTKTTASQTWTLDESSDPWDTEGETRQTPQLKTIVKEIVDRDGWSNGSPMAFILTKTNTSSNPGRRVIAYDQGPSVAPMLHVEIQRDETTEYYGYFNPDYFYEYSSGKFVLKYKKVSYSGTPGTDGTWAVEDLGGSSSTLTNAGIVSGSLWDGNWLNWLSMRRIDVLRKALIGGKVDSRDDADNQVNETEVTSKYVFIKQFNSTGDQATTPYNGNYYYTIRDGKIYVVDGTSGSIETYLNNVVQGTSLSTSTVANFNVHVQKSQTHDSDAYYNSNLAGVMHKLENDVRWGNASFNIGTGTGESGAIITNTIGTSLSTIVTSLEGGSLNTWTPLAESYYTAIQYFRQEAPDSSLDYDTADVPIATDADDPWYNGSVFVPCAKSFVILLTDGTSTKDQQIPSALIDFDKDGNDGSTTGCDGTDHLDDLALYARTTDLRSSAIGKSDLDGDQNLVLYTIYAFGDDDDARKQLKEAAINGGFQDRDDDNLPDGNLTTTDPNDRLEWDEDGDGNPDNYFEAAGGYGLEQAIIDAVDSIVEQAAAGTAVSVLATAEEGTGNLVQAFFRPKVTDDNDEVTWLGYLQSLWVDSKGNIREDTNQNQALNIGTDKVITYFLDSDTGDSKVKRFAVSDADPYPDTENDSYETIELDEPLAVWQGGELLAERAASDRKIFTYIDMNDDKVVDEVGDPFDELGEVVLLVTGGYAQDNITPFLGVSSSTYDYLGSTHTDRVTNLIQYIRGVDATGLRDRTFDYDDDGTDETWKLGDIINSTPVTVAAPPDNFHVIYNDESYSLFHAAFKNRETVVYVGANDGMLHAFTSWEYDSSSNSYTQPSGTSEAIGGELWAYIPQHLLPHLKWLPSEDYSHVFYVDMKPKVFDAKILPDDTHYTDSDTDPNWGTFLIVGFNFGGGEITATEDFDYDGSTTTRTFAPSYTLLDITDPRNPRVMWERTYTDLQTTQSVPAIVKVNDNWFAVFGSGPADCSGVSTKKGHVYVVDLDDGEPYQNGTDDWLFETSDDNAFMNSPVSLDKGLNFNVDGIYFGESYKTGANLLGKVYKITVPWVDGSDSYDGDNPTPNTTNYVEDPKDTNNPWQFHGLFDATRPVTASLALSVDENQNAWVYGGTGRYLDNDDKSSTDTEYFFGIRDPFFDSTETSYYHLYTASASLAINDLLDVDNFEVLTDGSVLNGGTSYGTFDEDLLPAARAENGWIRSLTTSKERILTKASILGGVVFSPSFIPNDDICSYGGDSNLYGVYFETGTAYYEAIFSGDEGTEDITVGSETKEKVEESISLGSGKSSSLGIHVGSEEGAKGFIQQSTGAIVSESLNPPFEIKSSLRSWREK